MERKFPGTILAEPADVMLPAAFGRWVTYQKCSENQWLPSLGNIMDEEKKS